MSLEHVRAAANTRLNSILSTYSELQNVFDIPDNDNGSLEKGYAVKFGEGAIAPGATRKVALNSTLIVSLTKGVPVRAADNVAPTVGEFYADIETIIASFFNDTFLGIPSYIRGIRSCSVSNPVLFSGNEFVQIDLRFVIDHTININYT